MDFASHTLLTSTIHRTLHAQGFSRSSNGTVLLLTDLVGRYLSLVASSAAKHAEHTGRHSLDCRDILEALDDMGYTMDDLTEYCGGEAREYTNLGRLGSWRREEDLAEFRAHLSQGLDRDTDDHIHLEFKRYSTPDLLDDEEEELPGGIMDIDEPTTPPMANGVLPSHSPTKPGRADSQLPAHVPDFLPPFPAIAELEPTLPEDPDTALMPPPPVPTSSSSGPAAAAEPTNKPMLPSQTLTSTSTSAKDYLIRNPYELSSLSSTPEWHLPPDVIPPPTQTKALPVKKAGPSQTKLATPHPIQSLIKAYHHILTHPPPPSSELTPPSHARHGVLLQLIFPSLSGQGLGPDTLMDKWGNGDTMYGALACGAPRSVGGGALNGVMPYPLGENPLTSEVPKLPGGDSKDKGKGAAADKEKTGPDDKVLAQFPANPGRFLNRGVGGGGDRVMGLVGTGIGSGRLSELGKGVLHPAIHHRTTRLGHPTPLYRYNPHKGAYSRQVYKPGVEAPWNTTFFPLGTQPTSTSAKGKASTSQSATKDKDGKAPAKKKRKKGGEDDDEDYVSNGSGEDEDKTFKRSKEIKKKDEPKKPAIPDARLWATWEAETKDWRIPLSYKEPAVPGLGSALGSARRVSFTTGS